VHLWLSWFDPRTALPLRLCLPLVNVYVQTPDPLLALQAQVN